MIITIIFIFLALTVYLNVITTIHLTRSDMYDSGQKRAQLVLIWFAPIIGSAIVLMLLMEEPIAEKELPTGDSFIVRFLLLSFLFSGASADSGNSDTTDSGDAVGFDGGGGDGGGGE